MEEMRAEKQRGCDGGAANRLPPIRLYTKGCEYRMTKQRKCDQDTQQSCQLQRWIAHTSPRHSLSAFLSCRLVPMREGRMGCGRGCAVLEPENGIRQSGQRCAAARGTSSPQAGQVMGNRARYMRATFRQNINRASSPAPSPAIWLRLTEPGRRMRLLSANVQRHGARAAHDDITLPEGFGLFRS